MSYMSNFGRSVLEKYGWQNGKGLGREEDGIVNPIKVNGNFNAYGLGHDVGKEFKNQWWDHVYNKTAANITVGNSEDGSVVVTVKEKFEVNQKVIPYAPPSSSHYSNFVKASTLGEEAEEEKDMSLNLSYDELFKICGGRTAHKGARHGLTMSAKLARLERQEQELIKKLQNSTDKASQDLNKETSERIGKSKKKKRASTNGDVCDAREGKNASELDVDGIQPESLSKKGKKRKKRHNTETEAEGCIAEVSYEECSTLESCDITDEYNHEIMKPKRSKKERKLLSRSKEYIGTVKQMDESIPNETEGEIKSKKKKRKRADPCEKENTDKMEVIIALDTEVVEKKKHKKRERAKSGRSEDTLESNHIEENSKMDCEECSDVGYKKKRKKSKHEEQQF